MTTAALRNLLEMPGPERRTEIETMLVAEFRAALQMEPDEPLPVDTPHFELGFTSLRLMETKSRLEELLGITISSVALFSRPTLAELTDYLAEEVMPGTSPPAESTGAQDSRARPDVNPDLNPDLNMAERALLDTLLPELNQE